MQSSQHQAPCNAPPHPVVMTLATPLIAFAFHIYVVALVKFQCPHLVKIASNSLQLLEYHMIFHGTQYIATTTWYGHHSLYAR